MGARDPRIDIARGLGIVLVVLGHALYGVLNAGAEERVLRFLLISLYTSHMALFFGLSGMLSGGMVRRGWGDFAQAAGARLLWPYVLWSLALMGTHHLMAAHVNTPSAGFAPASILWKPPSVMWFLYALGLGLLLLRLLLPLGRAAVTGAGLGLLAAPYLMAELPGALRFIGLFLLASMLRPWVFDMVRRGPVLLLAGLVMAATLALAWVDAAQPVTGYAAFAPGYIPALLAGPALLLALAGRIAAGRGAALWAEIWAEIGRHSMAIFVVHVFLTAGTRIALLGAGVGDWGLIVALATGLGVALPLFASRFAARAGWQPVLGWR